MFRWRVGRSPLKRQAAGLIATGLLALAPAQADATACPGADPCPYTAVTSFAEPQPATLARPVAVAIAPDQSVYVVDAARLKVVHYSREGQYLSSWGGYGSGNGQFKAPSGVAVDAAGQVWVSDSIKSQLSHFTAAGAWISSTGITEPHDVSAASNGRIAASSAVGVIGMFGPTGSPQGSIGIGNEFDLASPGRLIAEADGSTYAAISGSTFDFGIAAVVYRFDAAGAKLSGFSVGTAGDLQSASVAGIARRGSEILVADRNNDVIKRFTLGGTYLDAFAYSGGPPRLGAVSGPDGIAVDPADGSVMVADANNHRVQRFDADGLVTDWWGSPVDGELVTPGGLTRASDGTFWVADSGGDRVQHFSASGASLGSIASAGANGPLKTPADVAVAPSGHLYVTDRGNDRVVEYDAGGTYVRAFTGSGSPAGRLADPAGIGVAGDGSVFVSDQTNDRVVHFSATGAVLGTWGETGSAPGKFDQPAGVSVTADGSVLVADPGNERVQRLSAAGAVLKIYPVPVRYQSPVDATELPDGTVAAITSGSHIAAYTADGTLRWTFGDYGAGTGQLGDARGLVASGQHLYVTDALTSHVLDFDFTPPGSGPGGEEPGGEDPGGEDPGGEDPGGQDPGGQDPGGQDPGGQDPGGQDPGGQDPGGQDPGTGQPEGGGPGTGDPGTGTPDPGTGTPEQQPAGTLGIGGPLGPVLPAPGKTAAPRPAALPAACGKSPFSWTFTNLPAKRVVVVDRLSICGRANATVVVECRPAAAGCPKHKVLKLPKAKTEHARLDLLRALKLKHAPKTSLLIGYADAGVRVGIRFTTRKKPLGVTVKKGLCWRAGQPRPDAKACKR